MHYYFLQCEIQYNISKYCSKLVWYSEVLEPIKIPGSVVFVKICKYVSAKRNVPIYWYINAQLFEYWLSLPRVHILYQITPNIVMSQLVSTNSNISSIFCKYFFIAL